MPSLLSSALLQTSRNQPFLLLQSSTAQSCLPLLRALVKQPQTRNTTVLICLLYPPSTFLDRSAPGSEEVITVDRTAHVPGYDGLDDTSNWADALKTELLETVQSAPAGPLDIIIDSADTLLSDISSLSQTVQLLSDLLAQVRTRGGSSRLIIHALSPTPLLPPLTQTRFSPSLTHLIAHPTVLLTHLSTAFLTPPPPLSPAEKFWAVFIPIAERHYESEKLVFGPDAHHHHPSGAPQEFVVEIVLRGPADGPGRRRGVERALEGWSPAMGGPCPLPDLEGLKSLWMKRPMETQPGPDPTHNLSFNLSLTPEQQKSRAQVPLPYAHEGKPTSALPASSAILYDPDSADDLDDDDPDEDLDI